MIRVLAVSLSTLWWGCGDKGQSIHGSEQPSNGNERGTDKTEQGDMTSNTRNTSNNDLISDSMEIENDHATIDNIPSDNSNDEPENKAVLVETISKDLNEVMAPLQNVFANAESKFGGSIYDLIAPPPRVHRQAIADGNSDNQVVKIQNNNSDQVIANKVVGDLAIASSIVDMNTVQHGTDIVNGVLGDFTAMLRGALDGEVKQPFENLNEEGQAVLNSPLSIDAKPLEVSETKIDVMLNGDNCGHNCSH